MDQCTSMMIEDFIFGSMYKVQIRIPITSMIVDFILGKMSFFEIERYVLKSSSGKIGQILTLMFVPYMRRREGDRCFDPL